MANYTPEAWFDEMLGMLNISQPSCATCKVLFQRSFLGDLEDLLRVWDNRPFARDVQSSGVTCSRCWQVYAGASAAWPDVEAWDHVRLMCHMVQGLDPGEDDHFRVGALDCGPVPSVDRPRPWVEFHVNPSDAVARRIIQVPAPPDSDEWYQVLKNWVADCDKRHPDCNFVHGSTLPKRVIDLGLDGEEGLDVVLREPEHYQCHGPYIALSYSWGGGQNLTTTKANIAFHMTRIRWQDIPTLFRGVVKIARALSVRFLWIDALCIIQDDAADWRQEAQKMGSYYGSAWLTIAADNAPGVNHSIFPPRRSPAMRLDQASTGAGTPPMLLHHIPTHINMMDTEIVGSPSVQLFGRAWALQERLLSRRILHMGPEEAVWECCSALRCECGRPILAVSGTPLEGRMLEPFRQRHQRMLHSGPPAYTILGNYWEILLARYLAMGLSFDNDRLKAIAALANDFQAADQRQYARSAAAPGYGRPPRPLQLGHYVYGLWARRLPDSLLWATATLIPSSPGEPPVRNPNFPTWSWASVPGSWVYKRCFSNVRGIFDEHFSKSTVLEVPDESWDIVDHQRASSPASLPPSRIVIEGAAVVAKCRCIAMPTGTSTIREWKLSDVSNDHSNIDVVQLDIEPLDSTTEMGVICLEIAESTWGDDVRNTRCHGLLLEPSALFPSHYTRLGTLEARPDWFQANEAVVGRYSII